MTDAQNPDSEEPREHRETYRSPNDPDVVETGGEPTVVSTGDDRPVLVEPGQDPATEEGDSEGSALNEGTGEEGPSHRADSPIETPADAVPEPVVVEHPVAPAPADVATGQGEAVSAGTTGRDTSLPTEAHPEMERSSDAVTERMPAQRSQTDATPTVVAPAAPLAPASAPEDRRPIYIESPEPPAKKGNRGFGALMAFLALIAFGLVWAAVAAVVIATNSTATDFAGSFTNFLLSPAFWTPVAVFFVLFLVLTLVLNRAGWGWYIALGFLVGALVYAAYLGGALLTVSQQISPSEVEPFVRSVALTPLSIGAGLVAREISIWAGAAVSARGKRVKARNAQAQADYEKETAERKAEYERARAGRDA